MDYAPIGRFHQQVLLIAAVVTAITAWSSSGYYAADEHYQSIVFAQHHLGDRCADELPWEFDARIRSALLPTLAMAVIAAGRNVLHADPFTIAFLLRAITALCALLAVRAFVNAVLDQVNAAHQRAFVLLSYLLWFLPYQHVRFAAETWSGLLFIAALALLLRRSPTTKHIVVIGLLIGLSVQIRPPMILPCLGVVAWALVVKRIHAHGLLPLSTALAAALIAGALVDRWFYGSTVFTLGRYLHVALVGDPAHTFEAYPWYYPFAWVAKYCIWPIGALTLLALAIVTVRAPRHLLTWCIWPYLILLSVIPHKEVRFLFPLADLVPLLLITAWDHVAAYVRGLRPAMLVGIAALGAIDTIALLICGITPAGSGRTRLAEALTPARSGTLSYATDADGIWKVRIPGFYLPTGVEDRGPLGQGPPTDLVIAPEPLTLAGYTAIARSEPTWCTSLLDLYNSERTRPFNLWQRTSAAGPP